MKFPKLYLTLPEWLENYLRTTGPIYPTVEERMLLVTQLARLNVEYGTGGPFGAGIFNLHTHQLLAPGVNRVIPSNCSVAHAEVMAIMMAEQFVGSYELSGENRSPYELVTSCEPCAMCFGATVWAGVRSLVCGARDEDARRIGFDEGAKPTNWVEELERRGISVVRDVCRSQAAQVLIDYQKSGGIIYNG